MDNNVQGQYRKEFGAAQEMPVNLYDLGYSFVHACERMFGVSKDNVKLVKNPEVIDEKLYIPSIRDGVVARIPYRFRGAVEWFDGKLSHVVGSEKASQFSTNRRSLKIRGIAYQFPSGRTGEPKFSAFYRAQLNEMYVRVGDGYDPSAFVEEMMQVAATNRRGVEIDDKREVKTGFNCKDHTGRYGMSLTSGYGSLLCNRYFSEDGYKPPCDDSYFCCLATPYNVNYGEREIKANLEFSIAAMIEQIVGREKMEKMFFSSDHYVEKDNHKPYTNEEPSALIDELLQYDSIENVRKFLQDLDAYSNNDLGQANNLLEKVSEWFYIKQKQTGDYARDGSFHSEAFYTFQNTIPNAIVYHANNGAYVRQDLIKDNIRRRAEARAEITMYVNAINNRPGFPKATAPEIYHRAM